MRLSTIIIFGLLLSALQPAISQTRMNLSLGYYGEKITQPGAVLGFELEKHFTTDLSLPLRAELGYFSGSDFQVLFLELNQGFRRYFDNGLFVEQSLGLALMGTAFEPRGVWFSDQYGSVVAYEDGLNWGLAPSVSGGLGYRFSPNGQNQHMIWVRPKVYWNLLIRGLDRPYGALQIGYTYNFITK